jgi:hypothetical protein
MPETRGERIIFAIGALVIAALVALIVLEKATDRFETRHTSAASKQVATGAAIKDAAASTSPAISTAPESPTGPEITMGRGLLWDPSAGQREALPAARICGRHSVPPRTSQPA